MFFKKHNTRFVGTTNEFIEWLRERNHFKSNDEYLYTKNNIGNLNRFGMFTLEEHSDNTLKKNATVFSTDARLGYLADNAPTYPETTMIELKTEGYTQEEINEALFKMYKYLNKMEDKKNGTGFKDFLLFKR